MTPLEKLLAEVRELDEKATKGPWEYIVRKGFPTITSEGFRRSTEPFFDVSGDADAIFCARARTLLPELAEAADKLRSELGKAREALKLVKECGALERDPRYGDLEANDEVHKALRSIDKSGLLKDEEPGK
jgi:hypothetical protein